LALCFAQVYPAAHTAGDVDPFTNVPYIGTMPNNKFIDSRLKKINMTGLLSWTASWSPPRSLFMNGKVVEAKLRRTWLGSSFSQPSDSKDSYHLFVSPNFQVVTEWEAPYQGRLKEVTSFGLKDKLRVSAWRLCILSGSNPPEPIACTDDPSSEFLDQGTHVYNMEELSLVTFSKGEKIRVSIGTVVDHDVKEFYGEPQGSSYVRIPLANCTLSRAGSCHTAFLFSNGTMESPPFGTDIGLPLRALFEEVVGVTYEEDFVMVNSVFSILTAVLFCFQMWLVYRPARPFMSRV
jgi:hypothetical protein